MPILVYASAVETAQKTLQYMSVHNLDGQRYHIGLPDKWPVDL